MKGADYETQQKLNSYQPCSACCRLGFILISMTLVNVWRRVRRFVYGGVVQNGRNHSDRPQKYNAERHSDKYYTADFPCECLGL